MLKYHILSLVKCGISLKKYPLQYFGNTVKHVLNGSSQKDRKLVFKTNHRLMQGMLQGEFCNKLTFIKLPVVIKIFVLAIFEWPFYTGFTV